MSRPRTSAIRLLPAVALGLLLTGCAPTVSLQPAPQATSVGCAGIVVRLPDAIGSAGRRSTDAQGTAAWGAPASVTLTCGVTTPTVTTATCTTVDGVDWLLEQRRIGGVERAVLTTFGRQPGTQVVVDRAEVAPDTVLTAVSDPVAAATTRTGVQCRALSDPAA